MMLMIMTMQHNSIAIRSNNILSASRRHPAASIPIRSLSRLVTTRGTSETVLYPTPSHTKGHTGRRAMFQMVPR